ncbi:MAG: hypothetical protein KA354_19675 [Phycisphaerae bacterium]|nr:hypothetical protein [Phycisphaerae bacterium]
MSIRIVNRSQWPTPALRVLARWVAGREGLGKNWEYEFVFKSTCRRRSFRGTGGRNGQEVSLSRRYQPHEGWPLLTKDHRFKGAMEEIYRSRLDVLVGLMAHEAHHATDGHPDHFSHGGRIERAAMEFRCNQVAQEAVTAFRVEWLGLRGRIKRAMQAERDRKQARCPRLRAARRYNPDRKSAQSRTALGKPQNQAKLVGVKVREYQRRADYYGDPWRPRW